MRLSILMFLLFITMNVFSQNFQQYRWENRLLIIVDYSDDQTKQLQQLALFKKHQEGLADRKLRVFSFSKKGLLKGTRPSSTWEVGKLPNRFQTDQPFVLYLVGLDGGIKEIYNQPTALQSIFELIDTMPMRRAEIRQRNY